ncbi:DNRLRE domain-containing protein [Verrucomicrobium sp. BvORR034]|uniref:DNRLRE domain-containing protein n=1 Tax=Verrucomicrobium sp. BvORR034 TaxID=1396418 RepID=UPI0006793946|nr:DNRLRE domain-containing protein [Verrucomicrobium sp. BvORR034]
MTDAELQQLADLVHAHIEGRLTAPEREALEAAIEAGGESRRIIADLLRDHAVLHWDHVGPEAQANGIEQFREGVHPAPESATRPIKLKRALWLQLTLAASVALVALAAGMLIGKQAAKPATFATLVHADAATWGGGSLPTAVGSRLAKGKFRLEEGLATVKFDSGATVTLESPAVFEIQDAMNASLVAGTAVADVPESAHGFRIVTPSARVVDHGTRFAINVESDTGATRTHVFEGLVEVEHPTTDKVVQLRTGQKNRVEGDHLDPVSLGPVEERWSAQPATVLQRGKEWRLISTRDGRGKDGYTASSINEHTSTTQLLVKSSEQKSGPRRKAYLGFDLSAVPRQNITAAELILTFEPTGWGLASAVPDCEFEVYAITKEELENWEPGHLPWDSAPANVTKGNAVDLSAARLLGSFTVPRGVQKGEFTLQSEALRDFLREDANGQVTLMIFRKTIEINDNGLVHGMASSRHPYLPPPTLALKLAEP